MTPKARLSRVLIPVISLLVTSFLAGACSDKNVDLIGSSEDKFISPNKIVTWDADSMLATAISFENFRTDSGVATGYATRIGREVSGGKTVTATTCLKFSATFPSLDTATAVSASLILTPTGETSKTGTIDLDIKEVGQIWQAADIYSRQSLTLKSAVLAHVSIDVQSSATIEIQLPQSFAESLLQEVKKGTTFLADSSKGIALVTTSGSVLTTINTSSTKLKLVVDRKTTSGSTERLSKLMDVSQYAYKVTVPSLDFPSDGGLYLQSVTGSRSEVKFDLSELQSNAQIINAELILVRDETFSPIADSTSIITISYGSAGPAISSTYSAVAGTPNSAHKTFTANVTKMVQSWAGKPSGNYGFILTPSKESGTLQTWRFFGPSAPIGQRPRLVVTYAVSQ